MILEQWHDECRTPVNDHGSTGVGLAEDHKQPVRWTPFVLLHDQQEESEEEHESDEDPNGGVE
jgi:hypothetical protein